MASDERVAAYVDSRNTPQEIAQAIRELERKQDALHEARMSAHSAMMDASTLHRHASEAYDRCVREIARLDYELRQAIDREAKALVA